MNVEKTIEFTLQQHARTEAMMQRLEESQQRLGGSQRWLGESQQRSSEDIRSLTAS